MSRSNPTNHAPNPAVRWFEWNGGQGSVRYYDKEQKQNVDVGSRFTFLLLDQLASVGGWHESSESAIYSNEVRDTRQDVMVVKAFKGGTLAEGLYRDIRDRVGMQGGHFVANCYIAFKNGDGLEIGSMKFKGAALHAWTEFCKANRAQLYKKAVEITGSTSGKKGSVVYKVPTFSLKDLSEETNNAAVALDRELQEYLSAYMQRTKRDQTDAPPPDVAHDDPGPTDDDFHVSAPSDEEIPF